MGRKKRSSKEVRSSEAVLADDKLLKRETEEEISAPLSESQERQDSSAVCQLVPGHMTISSGNAPLQGIPMMTTDGHESPPTGLYAGISEEGSTEPSVVVGQEKSKTSSSETSLRIDFDALNNVTSETDIPTREIISKQELAAQREILENERNRPNRLNRLTDTSSSHKHADKVIPPNQTAFSDLTNTQRPVRSEKTSKKVFDSVQVDSTATTPSIATSDPLRQTYVPISESELLVETSGETSKPLTARPGQPFVLPPTEEKHRKGKTVRKTFVSYTRGESQLLDESDMSDDSESSGDDSNVEDQSAQNIPSHKLTSVLASPPPQTSPPPDIRDRTGLADPDPLAAEVNHENPKLNSGSPSSEDTQPDDSFPVEVAPGLIPASVKPFVSDKSSQSGNRDDLTSLSGNDLSTSHSGSTGASHQIVPPKAVTQPTSTSKPTPPVSTEKLPLADVPISPLDQLALANSGGTLGEPFKPGGRIKRHSISSETSNSTAGSLELPFPTESHDDPHHDNDNPGYIQPPDDPDNNLMAPTRKCFIKCEGSVGPDPGHVPQLGTGPGPPSQLVRREYMDDYSCLIRVGRFGGVDVVAMTVWMQTAGPDQVYKLVVGLIQYRMREWQWFGLRIEAVSGITIGCGGVMYIPFELVFDDVTNPEFVGALVRVVRGCVDLERTPSVFRLRVNYLQLVGFMSAFQDVWRYTDVELEGVLLQLGAVRFRTVV